MPTATPMPTDAIPSHALLAAARLVQAAARELGFAMVGIAPAAASPRAAWIRQWIDEGQHGEMAYLANHLDKRIDPAQLMPGAQAVIVVADRYAAAMSDAEGHAQARAQADARRSGQGRVARYTWGDDYHKVMKKRLFILADRLREQFPDLTGEGDLKVTVDTAPTLEREHATRAGLGWTGKHTLLIHPRLGSYLLLGTLVTTLPLADAWRDLIKAEHPAPAEAEHDDRAPRAATDADAETDAADAEAHDTAAARAIVLGSCNAMADHCGSCTRCIDACPTDCITPYRVNAQRCISYLTLEHRGSIDPSLHEAMGDWIAGCDICQEVCPHNRPRDAATQASLPAIHERLKPRSPAPSLRLLDVLDWSAEDRQAAFQGSALKRMKLEQVRRNAVIAAGNALAGGSAGEDAATLRTRIEAIAKDAGEDAVVRDAAQIVMARLTSE